MRRIAAGGSLAFYEGPIAADIVAKVRTSGPRPGLLAHDDLRSYSAIERAPICRPFRAYEVCGMPPPSSGGIAVAQILGIVARLPRQPMLDGDGRLRADAVHQFAEAGRLAFADRERYVGDPAFVRTPAPPYDGLLDAAYLDARAQLVGPRSMGRAEPGRLAPTEMPMARGQAIERPSTSHLSIVDADGNAVAMTTSIEDQFGARLMVRGFLLNNQLTDFSYDPRSGTQGAANRVEGGKRPRSAMAPTLVFRRDAGGRRGPLVLAIGSPGGALIINYVAQALIAMLDDGIDPGTALALPHFGSRNGPTELELERVPPAVARALEARGHALRYAPMTSGLHAIARDCRGETCLLVGAVDPRREGEALGR